MPETSSDPSGNGKPSLTFKGCIKRSFFFCLRFTPLLSGLAQTKRRDWLDGTEEFLFIWTISILPPLFAWLVQSLRTHTWVSLTAAGLEVIKPGEILVSTMALVAPAVWVIYEYIKHRIPFSNYPSFIISILFICLGSTVLFVMDKMSVVFDPTQSLLVGFGFYLWGLALSFLAIIYTGRFSAEPQKTDEKRMVDQMATFDPNKV